MAFRREAEDETRSTTTFELPRSHARLQLFLKDTADAEHSLSSAEDNRTSANYDKIFSMVTFNTDRSHGLVKCAENPAASLRSTSAFIP